MSQWALIRSIKGGGGGGGCTKKDYVFWKPDIAHRRREHFWGGWKCFDSTAYTVGWTESPNPKILKFSLVECEGKIHKVWKLMKWKFGIMKWKINQFFHHKPNSKKFYSTRQKSIFYSTRQNLSDFKKWRIFVWNRKSKKIVHFLRFSIPHQIVFHNVE